MRSQLNHHSDIKNSQLNRKGDIGSPFAAMGALLLIMVFVGIIVAEMVGLQQTQQQIQIIQKQTQSISQPALIVAIESTYTGTKEPFGYALADYYCQYHSGSNERDEINKELQRRIELVAKKSVQKAYLKVKDCTNTTCYDVYELGKPPPDPLKAATTKIPTSNLIKGASCVESTDYVMVELILWE